jgi:ABC-type transporter Mla MlaB component
VEIYQHDGATTFRFQLKGRLDGAQVENLEHAWRCASSVSRGKELVIDISGLTGADPRGVALLSRLRESGARFVGPAPPELMDFADAWGVCQPAATEPASSLRRLVRRLIRRLCSSRRPGGRSQSATPRFQQKPAKTL